MVELLSASLPHFLQVDQELTLYLKSSLPSFLFLNCVLSQSLDTLLPLHVDVKSVGERHPLGSINELVGMLIASVLIANDAVVNIKVIDAQSAMLLE